MYEINTYMYMYINLIHLFNYRLFLILSLKSIVSGIHRKCKDIQFVYVQLYILIKYNISLGGRG